MPEHKDKFNDILETNPRIKKYREKKRKEAIELEESRRESLKIMEQEDKEYKIIKKDLGYEPKKQPELNEYLRKKLKQSELFSLLIKDEKLRERVKKDLNFRIKKREIYKSTKDKGYSYKFYNRFDKYYFGKMKKLKNIVDNFDFSSERDLNIMKKEDLPNILPVFPLSNFILGTLSALLFAILSLNLPSDLGVYPLLLKMLNYSIFINFLLGGFNLIPLPPLDGSRMVAAFLKGETLRLYESIQNYTPMIFLAIIALSFMGISTIGKVLTPITLLGQKVTMLFLYILS